MFGTPGPGRFLYLRSASDAIMTSCQEGKRGVGEAVCDASSYLHDQDGVGEGGELRPRDARVVGRIGLVVEEEDFFAVGFVLF